MFTISFCFRIEIHCCTGFVLLLLLLTYDNLNLLGKSKKFKLWRAQVTGTLKKVTWKKKMRKWDGEEKQVSCTLHFMGTTLCFNLTVKRHRIQGCLKYIQCSDWSMLFFSLSGSKSWFQLTRVKLCRNNLKGNKNYFELAGGLSYQGLELLRVKLQWMYEGNPVEIIFGLS